MANGNAKQKNLWVLDLLWQVLFLFLSIQSHKPKNIWRRDTAVKFVTKRHRAKGRFTSGFT